MRTMCSREIFTKKCRQQQIFDSDLKGAWHYNHVTFTPIAKNFMLYCRLIYMLSILFVRLTIKVKVGIPESFKVGWYPPPQKKTGSSHFNNPSRENCGNMYLIFWQRNFTPFLCLASTKWDAYCPYDTKEAVFRMKKKRLCNIMQKTVPIIAVIEHSGKYHNIL